MLTPSEELQEQIDRYLNDALTPAEKQQLEERIKSDVSLSKEVDVQRTALLLVKAKAVSDFKNKLNGYSQGSKSTLQTPLVKRWYTWAAAASVVLAIAFYFYTTQTPVTEKLFTAYYEPATIERQITRGDVSIDEKTTAFEEYSRQHYTEALQKFETLLNKQHTDELLFYAGASALAINNTTKAILYFAKVAQNKDAYQWRGQWYLCLAYLKADKIYECKAALKQLSNQPNRYSKRAEALLRELK